MEYLTSSNRNEEEGQPLIKQAAPANRSGYSNSIMTHAWKHLRIHRDCLSVRSSQSGNKGNTITTMIRSPVSPTLSQYFTVTPIQHSLYLCFIGGTGRDLSDEEELFKKLFDEYNPSARPVMDSSHTVNVAIQFSLLHIKDLVSNESNLTVQSATNYRLDTCSHRIGIPCACVSMTLSNGLRYQRKTGN